MKHSNYFLILSLVCLSFVYYKTFIIAEEPLVNRLRGRILLQVEANGEAWYVYPPSDERYYLGRPDDAFDLMKNLGLGITNTDLKKIQISESSFSGLDSDNDGLSDMFEDAIGTDKNKIDTDNDSFDDKIEISGNYNPNGEGKIQIDNDFSKKLAGSILIQAEQNGEAWYINPSDNKRYFLGRPKDAFNVMRQTGLGISNDNLSKIAVYNPNPINNITNTVVSAPGKKKYSNTENKYSFEYPDQWIMSKIQGNTEVIAIRNYKDDIIDEKKAMITLAFVKVDENSDLNKFKTASKDGASKEMSEVYKINEFDSLKESFKYDEIGSKETTTYLKLNDSSLLMITMFSAGSHEVHDAILGDILRSVKVTE